MKGSNYRLAGYDNNGTVYDNGEVISRKVKDNYQETSRQIFERYQEADLKSIGIVETELDQETKEFSHKKHTITYPYEWPANMYKEAVLFHVELLLKLEREGLTLKDALPNNILFESTNPVFVDFLSLVFADKLHEEEWLDGLGISDRRLSVLKYMLEPYMVVPLVFMSFNKFEEAREMLSVRSCNTDGARPSWGEVGRLLGKGNISRKQYLKTRISMFVYHIYFKMAEWKIVSYRGILSKLLHFVKALEVTPPRSAYSAYYVDKQEDNFQESDLLPKQKTVKKILEHYRPQSVIDIGANTGWYSSLACKAGASVIAMEIDESCVDIIHRVAVYNEYPIIPLKSTFGDMQKEIYGIEPKNGADVEESSSTVPLYKSAITRFNVDLVLVLGLTHHLVLGEGRTIDSIFEVLAPMVMQTLVMEFIALDDSRVIEEPSFFANLHLFDEDSYNLDRFMEIGKEHFKSCEVLPSNPATRKILVFTK